MKSKFIGLNMILAKKKPEDPLQTLREKPMKKRPAQDFDVAGIQNL
jgi:hypothetical protein